MKNIFPVMVVLISIVLTSCGESMEQNNTPTGAVAVQTKIAFPSATASFTLAPATNTVNPTMTQNIPPTLTREERESYLLDYFKSNSDCNFPCWLGAIPGETTFTEFQATLQVLHIVYSPPNPNIQRRQKVELGGLDYKTKEVLNNITLFVEPDGKISKIEGVLHAYLNPITFAEVWGAIDIRELLLRYGIPSSISIKTDYNDIAGRVGYSIGVFYVDQGFAVYYNGGTDYQSTTSICPFLKDYQLITIGFSLQAAPFDDEQETTPTSLTELDTGLGTNDLYDIFTAENMSCLRVSSDKFK